jgi:FixJ family two-component response regulator
MIESVPPALIITNVSLPGISGHDAMRMFKEHAPDVPVMMIAGLPDSPSHTRMANAGRIHGIP